MRAFTSSHNAEFCLCATNLGGCSLPQPKVFIVFTSNFTESIHGNLDVAKVGIDLRIRLRADLHQGLTGGVSGTVAGRLVFAPLSKAAGHKESLASMCHKGHVQPEWPRLRNR
jgi:hypothetical protein